MFSKNFGASLFLAAVFSSLTLEQATAQTLYGSAGSQDQRENAMNADWTYNWGIEPNHDVSKANFEFVPMIWSGSPSGVGGQINRVLALEANHGVHVDYVLGFNEPELPTQSNMTVERAIDTWAVMHNAFAGTGIKLVSPAVSGAGAIRANDPTRPDGWLTEFMDEVEARNADADPNNDLRVDVIAYHFYTVAFNGTSEANKLIAQIDDLYERYGRPIWITEFAGTSFSQTNAVHSVEERQAFNREFLEALIPQFDARDYVERVAWWQFGAAFNGQYSPLSSFSGGVYTPSIIGEIYSRTTLEAGDTYNFAAGETGPTDVHYLKGGDLTNTGSAIDTALRAVDAIEGDNALGGSGDFGFEQAEDSFVRVRSGATLRKQGSNKISLNGTSVDNDGSLRIESGTLNLQNGAKVDGSGSMLLESGGTLEFGSAADTAISTVDQSLNLNGGTVQLNSLAAGGSNVISGPTVLQSDSSFTGDGNLTISGSISGSGEINKTGNGSLFVTEANTQSGTTNVLGGNLVVVNSTGSATGTGSVVVQGDGTLRGEGAIGGNLFTLGSVAPGVSESPTGSTSPAPDVDDGVVIEAIDFDFMGVQDDAPLTQTNTLSNGLRVVSGLDFGPGVRPSNISNEGNEFNVTGFTGGSVWGDARVAEDYLTFTVAPVEGLMMQLEDVSFEFRRNGSGAATHYRMFTSIDGFAVYNAGLNPLTFQLDVGDATTHTFTAAYQGNESVSEPIEVRIYGWNASSSTGHTRFYGASLSASFESDPNNIAFDPTGVLELGGNYLQLDFATLEIDLGGVAPGEFDQLQVDGNVTLNGTLDVSLIDGFDPTAGQTFDIITANSVSGTFDDVIAPDGMDIQVVYSGSTVSLQVGAGLVGDFDSDGDVDVDDIDYYVGNIGAQATGELAQLDFNGDGQVTADDLRIHIETYVQTSNGQTGTFLGDLNLDGTVNVLGDAFLMIGSLGNSVSSYGQGDINLDGIVNVLGDAFALVGNLNRTNAP